MNVFPTSPALQFPLDEQRLNKILVSDFQSGREQRRKIWALPKRAFGLTYNVLTQSEIDTLWNFHQQQDGPLTPFWFFFPYQRSYTGEYVGQGDGSDRLFELPGKSLLDDSSFKAYINGSEPSLADWLYNGGFEQTPDFAGWTQNNSTLDTGTVRSGTNSCKLVASGSDINGAQANVILVNITKKYPIDSYHNIPSYTAGTYKLKVQFYSDETGTTFISDTIIFSKSAITSGWEQGSKSVGPASLSPDITFPSNAKSMRVQQLWDGTPTGTAYMDDLSITIDGSTVGYTMLEGGGDAGADRVYFQYAQSPAAGTTITTDFTGILRVKVRFKEQAVSLSLFAVQLYSIGIQLIEVK